MTLESFSYLINDISRLDMNNWAFHVEHSVEHSMLWLDMNNWEREREGAYLIFEGDSIGKCGHVSFSEYDRIINHHSSNEYIYWCDDVSLSSMCIEW